MGRTAEEDARKGLTEAKLDDLLADIQVDELMFTIDIHDPDKRRQALDILAETRSPQTDSDATIN